MTEAGANEDARLTNAACARPHATLSVCMIVRDEEQNLADCLESVRPSADQIVVVDTGSTDATVEVALAHGAEVHRIEWRDDFAAARNESLRHARCRWILWLDADDRIAPEQVERLRLLKTAPPDRAFGLLVSNRAPGRFDERWAQLRVFPNDPRLRFERPIHEQVAPSVDALGLPLLFVDIRIDHIGYATPADRVRKALRNRALIERALADHPDDPCYLSALADSHCTAGELHAAIPLLRRVAALPDGHEAVLQAPISLADAHHRLGEHDEALRWLHLAIERRPERLDALFLAARCALALGDDGRAARHLQAVIAAGDAGKGGITTTAAPDLGHFRGLALVCLARLRARSGNRHEAAGLYERACAEFPQIAEAPRELALLRASEGRLEADRDRVRSATVTP